MQCKWLTPDNWARIQTDFASGVGLREIAASSYAADVGERT